jgi:ribose 5-phosphate isomerase A
MTADPRAALKREAAEAAAALVTDGMVVGLGTGSTAYFAIAALIRRVAEGMRITAIPTSERSAAQARDGGIPLVDFATAPELDITIDGADAITRSGLHLVKGLGGALLREKIVAAASKRLVIVADATKLVDTLGSTVPVPIEVVPFGWQVTAARLCHLAGEAVLRLNDDGSPYRTDGGNYILDCQTGAIADPAALDAALHGVVGVVETGLFIGRTAEVYLAGAHGVERLLP